MEDGQSRTLTAAVESSDRARGLAVIVTNDYTDSQPCLEKDQPRLLPLNGTEKDGKSMSDAFQQLGFVVHWERNISTDRFMGLIHEATSFPNMYHRTRRYTCIAFVFSGHGDLGDQIYLQDGSKVSIGDSIINPFLPKSSSEMGDLQKLFFFDACRGKQQMEGTMVSKSGGSKGKTCEVGSRGAKMIERIRVPEEGGFLVAFSTMSKYQAFEGSKGGAWLQRLAAKIRDSRDSIEDVLTQVNNELLKAKLQFLQQPEKLSRLNKVVFLHPDKDELGVSNAPGRKKPTIAAVFPQVPQTHAQENSQSLNTVQHQSAASIQGASCDGAHYIQLMSQYPQADFTDYFYVPPNLSMNVTYYRSRVTVNVPYCTVPIIGDSEQYFVNAQLSRDEAAKDALSKLAKVNQVPTGSHQQIESAHNLTDSSQHAAAALVSANSTQAMSLPPPDSQTPHDQQEHPRSAVSALQQMNTFFQKNKVRPQFEIHSDTRSAGGSSRYLCIVRYTLNGQQKKVDSGHFYHSKADAKEQVAKLVLSKENASTVVSMGAEGATPSTKVWKLKLKEYCDKKRATPELMPLYTTGSAGGGFRSTVTVVGCSYEGDVCKSKQEAEQSAAYKALQFVCIQSP